MRAVSTVGDLDLSAILRPGDCIVIGQACGEPTTLVEALIAQGRGIGGLSAFIATSFSGLLTPAATEGIAMSSMGAIGALRSLTREHRLSVIPCHVSQIGPMIEAGTLACDIARPMRTATTASASPATMSRLPWPRRVSSWPR
jgi:hypothetical protein